MVIYDVLLPWQREFLDLIHREKRVIGLCSRQIGKSFLVSFAAVEACVLDSQTYICVSTCERQAQELLKKSIKMATYIQGMLAGTPLSFTFESNATEIRFSTGGRLLAVPNNPGGIRGLTGNIVIDEACYVENMDELWQAVVPMLTSKFSGDLKVILLSTPAGASGFVYDLWTKNEDFAKIKKTIFDAGKTEEEIAELRKNCVDEDVFRSEYCCEFLDTDSTLFSYDLLRSHTWEIAPPDGSATFLGIDIGRSHDLTAISTIRSHNGKRYVIDVEYIRDTEFDDQFSLISKKIVDSKAKKVVIDASGIGAMLGENLRKKFGAGIVEPVQFTNTLKNELFGKMKEAFGSDALFIPNTNDLIDEIHSIKRQISPSGNISYSAPRNDKGHADGATSVALALRAAQKGSRTVWMPVA